MKNRISVMDIISLLLKRIKILIAALLIGAVLAFGYTYFFITPKYTSSVNMYVDNGYTEAMIQSGTPVINTGALAASQELVDIYAVLLNDRTFLTSVAEELDGRVSVSQLSHAISVKSVNGTVVMNISATTSSPQLSADICNTVAELAPEMLIRVVKAGSVETMGSAYPASAPSSPSIPRNTILGAIAALALAAVIIIIVDLLDTTIRDDEKIKDNFDIAYLGSVPSQTVSGSKKTGVPTYSKLKISEKTPFRITEAYKNIRTNIMFTIGASENKAIEITSSNPAECKSITTANLAITLAQTGAKVLLIDADMRRPVQHKIFGLDNSKGLSSVLAGLDELNICVKKNVEKNLDVFTAGPIPPNPAELIGSNNMKILMETLNQYYNIILIDTPPVGIVTDALAMSKYTNGILLLARHGSTKTGDIANSIESIKTVDAALLGTILVDVDTKNMSYSYKNKHSSYSYGKKYAYGYEYNDQNSNNAKA